jgi:predicted ribosome quality control (RQC) complex YloA/Tae2 family protein
MPSTEPKSNDQLPPPDAEKLKLLEARIDKASEYVAEQTSQSERHREALDVLTPQLEETLSRFQDKFDELDEKLETQRKRTAQNEKL